ncbi:MAG: sigma-54-dependent transcriptional regulator [Acidobacteriota bacterium]
MMRNERILILEDEKLIRWSMREKLHAEGYSVVEAETGEQGFALLADDDLDLLLLDYRLPDMSGIDILERVRREMPEVSVVMMTAYGTVETAVQAMKLGCFDYLTKPVNLDELCAVVQKALETTRLRREVRRLRSERWEHLGRMQIIGESPPMVEMMALIEKIVASKATTVLLEGESGTGKNLVAKAIHYGSARAERPFVTITCSAITESLLESELFGHERGAFTDAKIQKKGLLEVADGGTAFLDEISEMGIAMQAKLLRFLEDRTFKRVGGTRDIRVDVRVIAATNRNLEDAVREGRFREDLYYRLKVIPITLPPLRERREDIPLLVQHFIDHYNKEFHKATTQVSAAAMDCLVRYPWHGNIRELKNAIERVMILEDRECLDVEQLPGGIRSGRPTVGRAGGEATRGEAVPVGRMTLEEMEKEAIRKALRATGNNQVRAARLLGISRDTLRYRLKKFDLQDPEHGVETDRGSVTAGHALPGKS